MKTLFARAKELWGALPHKVQGAIVIFGTAVFTAFVDAINADSLSLHQLKHSAAVSVTAGIIALKAFISLPSNAQAKLDKTADDKASEEINKVDEPKP
jgi:hypothetical protein